MAKNLVDVDTFTANVSVPEDGDARNALSVETPFQQLSNRTRNLLNRITNNLLAESAQTFTRFVGAGYQGSADASTSNPGWLQLDSDPTIAVSVGSARAKRLISFDHVLPNGATITQVRVRVDPATAQATSGNRMGAQFFVGDITGTQASSSVVRDDGTSNAQWLTISGLSTVVDKTQRTYGVAVQNSANFVLDQLFGAEITFTSTKRFTD